MLCTRDVQVSFILSPFVTFFCGLFILYLSRLICRACDLCQNREKKRMQLELLTQNSPKGEPSRELSFSGIVRDHIQMMLSAQTCVGRVLGILVFVLSIGSLIIYFINSSDSVGSCSSYEDKTIIVDLFFNAFFSFYFGLRFLVADDKIKFWLEMNSIVDIFTIPPTFTSYYLKNNWLGLRFLRALRLLELPQILQILQVLKTSNSVKFSKVLSVVLSSWFTAAGFIHLVENSGDPWLKGGNSQNLSYFQSIYLIVATTSTVGFGDVVAKTSLGRIFIIFFTLISLIQFARYIPEIVELFANKRKYTNSYEVVRGKKFIVVCGNITVDSVSAFLSNFLRHNVGEISTEIVFLGESPPSLELESIFKCFMAYTSFVFGSALKWEDLRRAAVEYAEACLVIANPLCSDSYAEDTSNIMRVLSIKNYDPKTRVIIQILQSHNKAYLPKIPSWNWKGGDNIICFAELKLGFIAQGCLVPGLCTFLTSLFVELNTKVLASLLGMSLLTNVHHKVTPKQPWQKHFLDGLKHKILTQRLSDDFVGMTFPEVSLICFVKMNLMLIAIDHKSYTHSGLMLNPSAQVRLRKNTVGFFIAVSEKEVKRALFYCSACHGDVTNPQLIGKCGCKSKNSRNTSKGSLIMTVKHNIKDMPQDYFLKKPPSLMTTFSARTFLYDKDHTTDQLDNSGMFHWCKAVSLDKVILKRSDRRKQEFRNHIVACVFGDAHSSLMGLRNFVMPLRASHYTLKELKAIVFLGSLDYLQKEWRFLRNFPQIYILPGSALFPGDLHAANVEECSMCAVLAPPYKPSSSDTVADTEAILTTLNVRAVRISCSAQGADEQKPNVVPRVAACKFLRLWALVIKPGCFLGNSTSSQLVSKYRRVPVLTELKNPSNVHFIEQIGGMEGSLPGINLHLSTSFSTGAVFSGSFLDSLLATAFYNYRVLELLQMLVTGGVSTQLEQQFDKDNRSEPLNSCATFLSARERCKLGLLSLNKTILSEIEPRDYFGQVFCGSLNTFGILCLGIYRMIDEEKYNPENKRFVITRPAKDLKLLPSDLVFCAIPFSTSFYKIEELVSHQPYEIVNIESLVEESSLDSSEDPQINPVVKDKPQYWHSSELPVDTEMSGFSVPNSVTSQ